MIKNIGSIRFLAWAVGFVMVVVLGCMLNYYFYIYCNRFVLILKND